MSRAISKKALLFIVYITSLLYSFSYALPLFVNSTYITKILSTEKTIGIIYAISAVGLLLMTLSLPRILKRFGAYRTTRVIIILEILALIMMGAFTNPFFVIIAFILHQVFSVTIYLNLSAFLETFSENATTGSIRGVFLTVVNSAYVIAPFLAGMMLTNGDFEKIYITAAAFMIAVYILVSTNFKSYEDPEYNVLNLKKTILQIFGNHDLHAIISLQFLLNFFYAWMVVYTPIYLHTHMNIPMSELLGFIMPIALMPFVILQSYLGKIADTKFGEQEIMIAGIVIISISCISLTFITTSSIIVWAFALFMTRVGASAIEVMSESYFYKQIGPQDMHLISFTQVIRSITYFVAPLLGTLILFFVDFRFIFLILGLIMLIGIPLSFHFKDSR